MPMGVEYGLPPKQPLSPLAEDALGAPAVQDFSFTGTARLCIECDRKNICAMIKRGTAPCGRNVVLSLNVNE